MCGIVGVSKQYPDSVSKVKQAIQILRNRGPDETGFFENSVVAFGHTRLQVVDLVAGQQPMVSRSGRYVLVFNGEIYNYRALRKELENHGETFLSDSDTEVVLQAFSFWGAKSFERFQGMFAIAIYDAVAKTITLARDRLGVKPLCYGVHDGSIAFGSTVASVVEVLPSLRDKIDFRALSQFMAYGFTGTSDTPYVGLKKVTPGTYIEFCLDPCISRVTRFWFPETLDQSIAGPEQLADLRETVLEAVSCRLYADRPIGALLSGGVDSGIIVSCMASLMDRPVDTFTIGFGKSPNDESVYAQELSEYFGTKHHSIVLDTSFSDSDYIERLWDSSGDPMADSSLVPTALVAKALAEQVTVAFTGDGPDELWGGYPRHRQALRLEIFKTPLLRSFFIAARKLDCFFQRLKGKDHSFPHTRLDRIVNSQLQAQDLIRTLTPETIIKLINDERFAEKTVVRAIDYVEPNASWDKFTKYSFYELQTYMRNMVLVKVDTATMFHSVEARSPFLDFRFVEWSLRRCAQFKMHPEFGPKYLLKKAFESDVPKGYFDRPKQYFAPPVASWLADGLYEWVSHHLRGPVGSRLFDQGYVKKMLAEHLITKNRQTEIWSAVALSQWCDKNSIDLTEN